MDAYLALPAGSQIPVRDGLVIGRVPACDVMIDDTKCSRRHARLIVEGGVVEIEDLESSNGTLLNGKPVERRMLRTGDEIQIGKSVLRYVEGAMAPAPAAPTAAPPPAGDDVDLFGDTVVHAPAAPVAQAPPPVPVAPPPALVRPVTVQIPPKQEPPRPAPAVVEFEDEIVSVRKPEATPGAAKAPAGPGDIVRQQRLLQFHKQEDKGGLLHADVSQMAGANRVLAIVLILATAGGMFWLAMTLVG